LFTHLIYIPAAFQKKKNRNNKRRHMHLEYPKGPRAYIRMVWGTAQKYVTVQVMPEESRNLATKGMASWELNNSCMLSYRTKQCATEARKFDKAVQWKIACSSSSTADAWHLRQCLICTGSWF
jgi:hypothetical protein